jgi:crossover junction endodeoxyribonuclease RuvC
MSDITRILGLDCGTTNLGLSVIEVTKTDGSIIYSKYTKLDKDLSFEKKLLLLEGYFSKVIDKFEPNVISYESPYIKSRNGQQLIMVCGILVLCGARKNLTPHAYTASSIKKTVTGKGRADKDEVERSVRSYMKLDSSYRFENDHVSDSVAIAITWARNHNLLE